MRLIFFFCLGLFSAQSSAWAQIFCVQRAGAELRSSPSSSAQISWKVPLHMPLMGTGVKKNGYYEVTDVDGQKHWAASGDVTTQKKCLVVKAKKAKLRSGPGPEFGVSGLGVADRYYSFVDLGGEDGWTKVQDESGSQAWINLDQVWKPSHKLRMSFDR